MQEDIVDGADQERAGVISGPARIAGSLPQGFRSAFAESSLRDAEWIRLPLPGSRCPLTGLSRTSLLELGDRGLINLKRIRKPGATRGIVIIQKRSLLSYLESLEPEPAQKAAPGMQLQPA